MFTNQSYRLAAVRGLITLGIVFAVLAIPIELKSLAAEEPKTYTVNIKDFKFLPAEITAKVGDTIIWKNDDIAPHTATSKGKNAFDSGNIAPGESWSYVIKKKGTYPYVCAYHLSMKGKLVVR